MTTFVVIDDHKSVLEGTCSIVQEQYPEARIITAATADQAEVTVRDENPELVITDLSIPSVAGERPVTDVGLQLLKTFLEEYPNTNFVVQSSHPRSLIRIKPIIESHRAGFTITDKSLPSQEFLTKIDWSLKGLLYTPPEMRTGLEVKVEWLEVLQMAFVEGMTDEAIAKDMNVSRRTVRHYWTRIQDALEVYPAEGLNIRIQTYNEGRRVGLLD